MPPSSPPELAPGALLDPAVLRQRLRACGEGVRIYKGCRLTPADAISVGDFSQIDEGVFIFAGQGVAIGRHVHLAFGSSISGGGTCALEDFAGIGAGVRVITGTDLPDGLTNPTVPAEFRTVRRGHVAVGAHALIFTGSIVLPGVAIGEGAVVSAGSIVHHDLKPWGIYGGSPLVQTGVRPKERVLALAAQLR